MDNSGCGFPSRVFQLSSNTLVVGRLSLKKIPNHVVTDSVATLSNAVFWKTLFPWWPHQLWSSSLSVPPHLVHSKSTCRRRHPRSSQYTSLKGFSSFFQWSPIGSNWQSFRFFWDINIQLLGRATHFLLWPAMKKFETTQNLQGCLCWMLAAIWLQWNTHV